ncbi:LysM peptidoglycan-binding domain-containing M23 family metallopeptidase [Candidatus Berkelbacteria bacterium]|nr:LysM peptidoglycan-binding domain-containing M23 family metallopeptidase [Candidatus Berkelbacteria bacterium]MBI4029850.1 LysM peptidoglycan-binding domain-containing M23 family metallopeptidase [Candidatus Berkelbacteria bacterium]
MFKQILKSVGGVKAIGQKHWGVFVLALFVFVGNLLPRQNAVALGSELTLMPEEEVETIVTAIAAYTPDLSEDAKLASVSFDGLGGFLGSKPLSAIQKEPIKYEVQKGDTYSTIAQKFELHVATILETNKIDDKSTKGLQPGQILTIPFEDTSSSMTWLDEENKATEEARKAEEKKRQQKLAQKQKQLVSKSSIEKAGSGFQGESGGLIVPIRSNGITRGLSRFHTGIDYRADTGTTVVAAAAGKIVEKTGGWGSGWGLSVVIDHGGGKTTRYAHLSGFEVGVGNYVEQGQVVGYSGNSGWSTGPHLHFEERINGRPVNPF